MHLGCPVVEGVFGGRRRRRGEVAVEDRACADFIARSGSNVVGRNIDPKFKRSEVRLKPEAGAHKIVRTSPSDLSTSPRAPNRLHGGMFVATERARLIIHLFTGCDLRVTVVSNT